MDNCPCNCPNYDGYDAENGHKIGECEICGGYIFEGDDMLVAGGMMYCGECVTNMEIGEIMRICEIRSVRQLLEYFGY